MRNFVDIKVSSESAKFNYTFNSNGLSRIETCSGSKKGIIKLVDATMNSAIDLEPDKSVVLF